MKNKLTPIIFACALSMISAISGGYLVPTNFASIKFESKACIVAYKNYNYLICDPIIVDINETKISIPKDFYTDLASVPRWYWFVMSPAKSETMAPSILHDYLYSCSNGYSRNQIDDIFYYSLISSGTSKLRAYEMYLAVRIFGKSHYYGNICDEKLLTGL